MNVTEQVVARSSISPTGVAAYLHGLQAISRFWGAIQYLAIPTTISIGYIACLVYLKRTAIYTSKTSIESSPDSDLSPYQLSTKTLQYLFRYYTIYATSYPQYYYPGVFCGVQSVLTLWAICFAYLTGRRPSYALLFLCLGWTGHLVSHIFPHLKTVAESLQCDKKYVDKAVLMLIHAAILTRPPYANFPASEYFYSAAALLMHYYIPPAEAGRPVFGPYFFPTFFSCMLLQPVLIVMDFDTLRLAASRRIQSLYSYGRSLLRLLARCISNRLLGPLTVGAVFFGCYRVVLSLCACFGPTRFSGLVSPSFRSGAQLSAWDHAVPYALGSVLFFGTCAADIGREIAGAQSTRESRALTPAHVLLIVVEAVPRTAALLVTLMGLLWSLGAIELRLPS